MEFFGVHASAASQVVLREHLFDKFSIFASLSSELPYTVVSNSHDAAILGSHPLPPLREWCASASTFVTVRMYSLHCTVRNSPYVSYRCKFTGGAHTVPLTALSKLYSEVSYAILLMFRLHSSILDLEANRRWGKTKANQKQFWVFKWPNNTW